MGTKNLFLVLFLVMAMPVFAQDADMSLIPYRKGDLWGYASPDKNIVITPEYEEANFFYEGFACVKKGGKYGYIKKNGQVAIPFKFITAKPFRTGYIEAAPNVKKTDTLLNAQKTILFAGASLKADGYEICINTRGEKIPKCPAINENTDQDLKKSDIVTTVSNYSTIQKSDLFDKIMGDYKMPGAEGSYYIAIRNNNYGVFNNKFEVIVPFEYKIIEKFKIGIMFYLLTEKDGLKGLLFGNGSPYMAEENTQLICVEAIDGHSYFVFTKEGKTGIRNTKYMNVAQAIYTNITYDDNGGFVLTGNDNSKGFYFLNNNLLEPKYADLKVIKGGEYVMVKSQTVKSTQSGKLIQPGRWGYVNNNYIEFFED